MSAPHLVSRMLALLDIIELMTTTYSIPRRN